MSSQFLEAADLKVLIIQRVHGLGRLVHKMAVALSGIMATSARFLAMGNPLMMVTL
jgi:hypothetical protein